jgi:predicted amidohydrolase
MIVGYIQNSPKFGEKSENFKQVLDLAAGVTADLIVLPELFAAGYTFTSRKEAVDLAESPDGETFAFLREIASRTGAVVVHCYRKIHLFNKEKLWFDPGNLHPGIVETGGVRIGMMICFDWIFPETARTLALQGADIIAHPANLVLPYCQNAMVTRCLENRVYAVTANRIGEEHRGDDRFIFTGMSQITSFNGEVLSKAPRNDLCKAFTDVEIEKARDKMLNPYNDLLSDRRKECYIL